MEICREELVDREHVQAAVHHRRRCGPGGIVEPRLDPAIGHEAHPRDHHADGVGDPFADEGE
jgi:hypothetical protein